MSLDIDKLDELYRAATAGKWIVGDHYGEAGTHPPVAPDSPDCVYCAKHGLPTKVWIDKRGVEMHRHRLKEWSPDEHIIETEDGETRIAGMIGYDDGGIETKADAAWIVAIHNAWPAICDILKAKLREQLVSGIPGAMSNAELLAMLDAALTLRRLEGWLANGVREAEIHGAGSDAAAELLHYDSWKLTRHKGGLRNSLLSALRAALDRAGAP